MKFWDYCLEFAKTLVKNSYVPPHTYFIWKVEFWQYQAESVMLYLPTQPFPSW